MQEYLASIFQLVGYRKRLPPRPSTEVHHQRPRLGLHLKRRQLAALILNFELSVPKLVCFEQIELLLLDDPHPVGRVVGGNQRHLLPLPNQLQKSHGYFISRDLERVDTQRKRGSMVHDFA